MYAKNGRWSLVTSASGKRLEAGSSASANQARPKATGRCDGTFDVLQRMRSRSATNRRPATTRVSYQWGMRVQSLSAVSPAGTKNNRP